MLLQQLHFPSGRWKLIWADAGYSGPDFAQWMEQRHGVMVQIVSKRQQTGFEVLARRWVVERTWSWLMNHPRLQIDCERDPIVHEGFVWAAPSRMLLRRLTEPEPA